MKYIISKTMAILTPIALALHVDVAFDVGAVFACIILLSFVLIKYMYYCH